MITVKIETNLNQKWFIDLEQCDDGYWQWDVSLEGNWMTCGYGYDTQEEAINAATSWIFRREET